MNKNIFFIFGILVIGFVAGIFFVGFQNSEKQYPAPITESPRVSSSPSLSTSTPVPVPELKSCRKTGCSGQICSDEDTPSNCEYKEEYICYQKATCERQKNGKCGWTQTALLTACLQQYE